MQHTSGRQRQRQAEGLARRHGSSAHHRQPVRCRAVRPLVVRGADLPRRSLPPAPPRPACDRSDQPRRLPGPSSDQPGGDSVRLVVGLEGVQRVLARREQRVGLPPSPRGRGAHGGAGASPSVGRRAHHARAQSGGARAHAHAEQRLDVHHAHRDDRVVRHPPDERAHPALQPSLPRAEGQSGTEPWLADVEAKDNLFPQLDYRIYAS